MALGQGGGQGMNNLTTLIKRLEAATSRLEDIASSSASIEAQAHGSANGSISAASGIPGSGSGIPDLEALKREGSIATVQQVGKKAKEEKQREEVPERIAEMDGLIEKEVKAFTEASKGIDDLVEEQASSVAKAFADQRRFLLVTTKAQKPDPKSKEFMDLLSDLQQDMGAVGDIRDSHRASPMKEHLAMVGEGIGTLQWLVMDGKPADHVGEVIGGAQMYGNRVLKNYKEGDQAHVKYVQAYYALLKALQSYIKKHYPSGVTWNSNGTTDAVAAYRDADEANDADAEDSEEGTTTNGARETPSSSSAGGPPPPPPPPLPDFSNVPASSSNQQGTPAAGSAGDMGAVFEQLNRGESVTSGLKKVDKSQMTHKNPYLRASGTVPGEKDKTSPQSSQTDITRSRSPGGGPEIKPKPPSMRQNSSASQRKTTTTEPKKEPKTELDGNKYIISHHSSPSSPIELDVSLSQSILITNCTSTTIILHGKANAISISNSPKTQILIDSLVSSIDVIKCNNFAVQVEGTLPTIMLDQVDGASIYLSRETMGTTEVFTSKCSSVNVVLPPPEEEGEEDSVEHPLPEQIRTVVKEGRLVHEIVEHAG